MAKRYGQYVSKVSFMFHLDRRSYSCYAPLLLAERILGRSNFQGRIFSSSRGVSELYKLLDPSHWQQPPLNEIEGRAGFNQADHLWVNQPIFDAFPLYHTTIRGQYITVPVGFFAKGQWDDKACDRRSGAHGCGIDP